MLFAVRPNAPTKMWYVVEAPNSLEAVRMVLVARKGDPAVVEYYPREWQVRARHPGFGTATPARFRGKAIDDGWRVTKDHCVDGFRPVVEGRNACAGQALFRLDDMFVAEEEAEIVRL
jgi:hypothetical protein